MKKLVFLLAIVVLAGGAWYMDKTMNKNNPGGSSFEKAMQLMKNLQSSAIPVVLTESELDTLEAGYQDALVRKPQITNFRNTDLATLTQKLIAAGLTGTGANDPQTRIIDLATGLVDDYNPKNAAGTFITPNPITVLINANLANSTQAVKDDIKKIADSVNRLTNDVLITNLFINQYGALRPNLCQKTADTTNNQYVAGTVTLRYSKYRATITLGGSGYTTAPEPTITATAGSNCVINGAVTVSGGAITAIPDIICKKDSPAPTISFPTPTAAGGIAATATLASVAVTPIVDSCTNNTLTEHICSNLKYTVDAEHDVSTACEFGCNAGACKKGSIGTVAVVDAGTDNGLPITEVKANQTFFLKVTPARAHTATATSNAAGTVATMISGGLGYTTAPTVTVTGGTCTTRPTARATVTETAISSVKLIGGNCTVAPTLTIAAPNVTPANTTLTAVVNPSTCNLAANLQSQPIVTSGATLYFGPITCSTVNTGTDQTTLNVAIKEGTQTIDTVAKPLTIGGVTMSKFEITAPTNVAAGNTFDIVVKTVGNNNIPYTNYTDDFFIVVEGDDDAVFPKGPQKMPAGLAEKTISGIKFSNAGAVKNGGNIKITIRGTGVSDTAEKNITVTAADLGVRKANGSYVKDITLNVGDTYSYKWDSANGTTGSSSYTCVRANGAACAGDTVWVATGSNGIFPTNGSSAVMTADYKGITYTITYKVVKTITGGTPITATDTIVVRINE